MLKSHFDAVMERRSTLLLEHIGDWLPDSGPVLDLGSGTGHLSARLEREMAIEMVPADVSDLHVMGRTPVLINEGTLPFEGDSFKSALLVFMLHYPVDPATLLREASRVTRGPIVLVQSLYRGRLGLTWLRIREFVWTYIAFHISRVIGYVPACAKFSMNARRFYTTDLLLRDIEAAGLRVRARRERAVLPRNVLVVSHWLLEREA